MYVAFPPVFGTTAHPVEAARRDVTGGTCNVCPPIFISELNSVGDASACTFWASDAVVVKVPWAVCDKSEVACSVGINGNLQVMPAPQGRATVIKDLDG